MALTELKLKDLIAKKFDDLYGGHQATWVELAQIAYEHAKAHITGGAEPRPDDIAKVLIPMLQVNDTLRAHQEFHSARPSRWVQWFAEYVIDLAIVNPAGGTPDA